MRVSRLASSFSETRSERPQPRLSKTITRAKDPSWVSMWANAGSSHIASMFVTQPMTNARSIGPSPKVWYAM